MLTAGLDIGSRTIALVEWDGERVVREEVVNTGIDPLQNSRRLMSGRSYAKLVATGYGRGMAAEREIADDVITEIKAYGIGAHHLYPDVQTVLDIGGQDSKVILVKSGGGVAHFEMNDRCAAGTGRFLENMARALDMEFDRFSQYALEAEGPAVRLSSTCTVFAESEVVSLIGRGEDSRRVALGIHQAIVSRISAMIKRVGFSQRFVFAGGGAHSLCLRRLFARELGIPLSVPDNPQTVGALGAAIHAANGIWNREGENHFKNN
jgi:(R)-2-hydroxyacyl-CoA dehydratese activating ATPase